MIILEFLGRLLIFIGIILVIRVYIHPIKNLFAFLTRKIDAFGELLYPMQYEDAIKEKVFLAFSGIAIVLGNFLLLVSSFIKLIIKTG